MPDNPLLRIGPFSRAASLSVKALRAYHEAGLLVPAEVDPQTGYRSYSVAQLTDAAVIRRLRDLDVPLQAVRQVLDARDPEVTKKVLAEHGSVLEARLATTQQAIDELYVALDAPALHTPVHIRHEQPCTVLAHTSVVTEAEWSAFLDRAHRLLVDAATMSGTVVDGPFGGCYPTLVDDDAQEVTAYLPVTSPPLLPDAARSAGVRVDEVPGADVAVLAHRGDYDTLADTYRTLGAWVAAHADPADLPVRELYLVSPADTEDPAALRTEVRWPVLIA
ncbi:MAG: MerR family transcriptional regulator [Actinomycetota bacterium]|nr:MerR family transcriptional regulator [Actinomycetota bacterium]